ncbi:tripartite motif-containing protein 45-like isoform X2 [Dreissena polymorpha]|nr:tripartite motif-containing protein 45-like isoform X2 [Dreissena polymorpha]
MATSTYVCGLCFEEHVVGFCNNCSLRLCHKCLSNHTKVVMFNDHQVVPFKPTTITGHVEMSIHEVKCRVHKTDSKSLYCGKHDVTICGRCVLSAHMACKDEIVDLYNTKFDERNAGELLSTLNKLEETINVLGASFDENVKLSDDCQEKYAKSIEEFRNKLNTRLDKLQSIAENAGKSKHTQNRSKLDQVQEQCKQTKRFITEQRDLIHEMSQKKKGGELYVFSKRFEQKMNEINALVERVRQNNCIQTYSFEENVKMRLAFENNFNEIGRLDEACVDSEEVNEISKESDTIGKRNQTPPSTAGLVSNVSFTIVFVKLMQHRMFIIKKLHGIYFECKMLFLSRRKDAFFFMFTNFASSVKLNCQWFDVI